MYPTPHGFKAFSPHSHLETVEHHQLLEIPTRNLFKKAADFAPAAECAQ
jgi:hypothetical protein